MREEDLELGLGVQELLNTTIRPLLNVDAGDAEILDVVDGHVTLELLGSCGRCLFRASCASYTVLDRLEAAFDGTDATFSVRGVSVARETARMGPGTAPPAGS